MYKWLKLSALVCLILFGGIFVLLLTTHGGFQGHLSHIIQCIKNPVYQSIPVMLEQMKRSCLTEKEQLNKSYISCTQDLEALHHNYTTQGKLLVKIKKEKDDVTKERDQLSEDCKQNPVNQGNLLVKANKEKEDLLQLKSFVPEEVQVQPEISFGERTTLLADKAQIFARQLNHIELLNKYIKEMETCRVVLKEFCTLKKKSRSLNHLQYYTMNKFEEYLGCKDPLPEDHYDKILSSYTKRLKEVLQLPVIFIMNGDLDTETAQEQVIMNLPYENCQFLCTYTEDEENELDADLSFPFNVGPAMLFLSKNELSDDDDYDDDDKITYLA